MSDLQLEVDPEEEATFLSSYGNYHFNPLGMCCPVISCPVTSLFERHGTFIKHFHAFHSPSLPKFSCNTCDRVFNSKKNKRGHRFCHGQKAAFFTFFIPNPNYINPGNLKLPLPLARSAYLIDISQAQLLQHRREQEHQKRQEYSQYCGSCLSPAEIMFNFEQSLR